MSKITVHASNFEESLLLNAAPLPGLCRGRHHSNVAGFILLATFLDGFGKPVRPCQSSGHTVSFNAVTWHHLKSSKCGQCRRVLNTLRPPYSTSPLAAAMSPTRPVKSVVTYSLYHWEWIRTLCSPGASKLAQRTRVPSLSELFLQSRSFRLALEGLAALHSPVFSSLSH